jgi:DNA phosphorothioation-dependent restriction protein DptG
MENKRFEAEQKQAKKDALIQAQKENAAKHKTETAALQKRINAFIENFYDEINEEGEIVIDEDDCKDLSKAAKKLYSEMEVLFSEIDVNDTLHGKALAILVKDLSPKKLNGDLDLEYPEDELKLFADCLTKGVMLGDSENSFESDDED